MRPLSIALFSCCKMTRTRTDVPCLWKRYQQSSHPFADCILFLNICYSGTSISYALFSTWLYYCFLHNCVGLCFIFISRSRKLDVMPDILPFRVIVHIFGRRSKRNPYLKRPRGSLLETVVSTLWIMCCSARLVVCFWSCFSRIYRAGGVDPATELLERNLIANDLKQQLLVRPALEDLEKRGIKPQEEHLVSDKVLLTSHLYLLSLWS